MRSKLTVWLGLVMLALVPGLASGQDTTAKIHGHAQDPANAPMPNAQVILSTDAKTPLYTFTTDQNGDYKGEGIKPGTYYVTLYATPDKAVDRADQVKFTSGTDNLQDFDLSRPDYIAKLPPEQKKALEEAKKKNAEINKENQGIGKLNELLKQALDLDTNSKKPNPELEAADNNALGEVYASTNKLPDATASYDAAAKLQPTNAAMYYTNETIVLSRSGQTDGTIAAADKAIAADPSKPVPYYLKGQALISKATVDPKTQKIVAPPGTADAYNKYLELAPNGPMAPEAKSILAEIGEKVTTKYSAKH
jgi:hypothetical protein